MVGYSFTLNEYLKIPARKEKKGHSQNLSPPYIPEVQAKPGASGEAIASANSPLEVKPAVESLRPPRRGGGNKKKKSVNILSQQPRS